jgi:deazaflavin-dependent oxidoreductase (nitroreductase family)
MTTTHPTTDRYLAPSAADRAVNRVAARLTRMGFSVWGSRELTVVGRRSGQPRTTVVNLLEIDGQRYLVSPRGTTDWVRNIRAAEGHGQLRVGRRREAVTAVELDDAAKPPVLRPYLERWAFEVGRFFDGVGADATDEQLAQIAPNHPVFRLEPAA